jgi:hypothetical protein
MILQDENGKFHAVDREPKPGGEVMTSHDEIIAAIKAYKDNPITGMTGSLVQRKCARMKAALDAAAKVRIPNNNAIEAAADIIGDQSNGYSRTRSALTAAYRAQALEASHE